MTPEQINLTKIDYLLARALAMRTQFTVCSLFPQSFSKKDYWNLPDYGAKQTADTLMILVFPLKHFITNYSTNHCLWNKRTGLLK